MDKQTCMNKIKCMFKEINEQSNPEIHDDKVIDLIKYIADNNVLVVIDNYNFALTIYNKFQEWGCDGKTILSPQFRHFGIPENNFTETDSLISN